VPSTEARTLPPAEARPVLIPEKVIPGLDRPVSLDLRGVPLNQAIGQWSEASKVNVLIHPGLLKGPGTPRPPVWLRVSAMPAKGAFEWICRLTDAWYAVDRGGLWLVPDYRWVAGEPVEASVTLVGGLFDARRHDLEDFLQASVRVFLEHHPSCRVELEPNSGRLTAVLPRDGQDMLARVIEELKAHASFGDPKAQLPSAIPLPAAPGAPKPALSSAEIRARLQRTVRAIYTDVSAQDVLAEIVDRTGVSMAWDWRSIPDGRRRISLSLGYVPAERLLNELVLRCYLRRVVWEPGRGFWIYPESQVKDLPWTRQQAWQRVIFRSYPALGLVSSPEGKEEDAAARNRAQTRAADRLVAHVMERLGGPWREPAYAIGYNFPTGRLLLQHEIEEHEQIQAVLEGYRRRVDAEKSVPSLKPETPGTD
jgi:hypothetical protein